VFNAEMAEQGAANKPCFGYEYGNVTVYKSTSSHMSKEQGNSICQAQGWVRGLQYLEQDITESRHAPRGHPPASSSRGGRLRHWPKDPRA
jgi:hypothetical protein